MADAARASIPATAVADELLKLTSKVLAALEDEMAEFEDGQASKQVALQQLVDRDREAVTRATEQLNDLYRTAREIADNKGRRDILEGVLRKTVEVDANRTFDQVVDQLESEMKLARGITGAMRVPDIGALLNQAAVQVDHLEARADALEANLGDGGDSAGSAAQIAFDEASATLRRDLDAFDAELPLSARGWDAAEWSEWQPSAEAAPLVRFGRFTDDRLGASGVPALIDLEADAGLLIEPGRERERAVAAAQSLSLRLLTAFPAGTARFTFIDPSALGESVLPFQRLVSGEEDGLVRVLTDERAIEDALAALAETTDGPRRREVVVVFDHPTGMSLRGVTLLRALADSGARRGVTTIVVKDPRPVRQPAEARALPTLRAVKPAKKGFSTATADGNWQVALDEMPAPSITNDILAGVELVAEQSPESSAVELVDEATWWLGEATEQLQIVLGQSAHAEPLVMSFDESTGTVVASGQRGSGLTTMLHGVISDIGVTYPPAEVQLMLVGLGGSRDFEDYGHRRLPHARLVASSADRELAVSALESAVAEITRRLVVFQAADTSRGGYRQYREETGNPLPRLVVIVAGADELFAHHDKLARQTRDLLARFALDGGVAGVHLVLTTHDASGTPRVLDELADDAVTPCRALGERTWCRIGFGSRSELAGGHDNRIAPSHRPRRAHEHVASTSDSRRRRALRPCSAGRRRSRHRPHRRRPARLAASPRAPGRPTLIGADVARRARCARFSGRGGAAAAQRRQRVGRARSAGGRPGTARRRGPDRGARQPGTARALRARLHARRRRVRRGRVAARRPGPHDAGPPTNPARDARPRAQHGGEPPGPQPSRRSALPAGGQRTRRGPRSGPGRGHGNGTATRRPRASGADRERGSGRRCTHSAVGDLVGRARPSALAPTRGAVSPFGSSVRSTGRRPKR